MDPLSIAVGVVGITSGGITIATRLHDIVDRLGVAHHAIEAIVSDLNFTSSVLDELRTFLDAPSDQRLASEQLVGSIKQMMEKIKFISSKLTS